MARSSFYIRYYGWMYPRLTPFTDLFRLAVREDVQGNIWNRGQRPLALAFRQDDL